MKILMEKQQNRVVSFNVDRSNVLVVEQVRWPSAITKGLVQKDDSKFPENRHVTIALLFMELVVTF